MLDHLAKTDWSYITNNQDNDTQAAFDQFYCHVNQLLNGVYPLSSITVTSRDPPYVTAAIKSMLRQKNKLMRKGQCERAHSITNRIKAAIIRYNSGRLENITCENGSKIMWQKVRQITGKDKRQSIIDLCPNQLNAHYAAISTDQNYTTPLPKHTCHPPDTGPTDWDVFQALDHLKSTATGLDGIPAWFLKLASHRLAEPIAYLFRKSLAESKIPFQWKMACITPVPKHQQASQPSDYRPISITPVISRVLERLVIHQYIYPLLNDYPSMALTLSDQYAFRPSGSTTAALINILQDLSDLSQSEPYVLIIALDFSKAFDTVRHSSLIGKIANLPVADSVYNWLIHYLSDRSHCTKIKGNVSDPLPINCSIIQGSPFGPVNYILNATDLKPVYDGNKMHKYADDTYVIIPADRINTISQELAAIAKWATTNNLKLNISKSRYMVV